MAITFIFCVLGGRFFYIQGIWKGELMLKALDQWTREIPIIPERGLIVDANNKVLADNITSYSIFARSVAVKDKKNTSIKLSKILNMDENKIYDKLTKKKVSETTICRHVDKSIIEKLEESNIEGVYYSRDNTRVYPKDSLLCQVLGFTSIDNVGVTGIEKYYDKDLLGKKGELLYETDLVGKELKDAVAMYRPAERGMNIQLTIDSDIQSIVENIMEKVYRETSPASCECIVLNPQNFDILAMVNYPGYNLNDIPRDNIEELNNLSRNKIVCDIYEPGSTFKIITAAINIEESIKGNNKAFKSNYIFPSSRIRRVDGTIVKCWSNHANGKHSNQTLGDALNNSCNPCFTDIALSLGKETFYKYLNKFGFGKTTGIDFSGESPGIMMVEQAVRNCDLARIGFGQTIAVSTLQLALATAASINGGNYYKPHLLKKIYSNDGYVLKENKIQLKNNVISKKASKELALMLEDVVKNGSGKKAYIKGYRVGGKTGTAQKFEDGHIAMGKYVSSFVGFFPVNDPKYLTLIKVNEPKGAYYGSIVAAPLAKDIFEGIISLKNIQPY